MTKIMLVTGASRGIGAATARLAGAVGYKVCINYANSGAAAEAVVADIVAAGGEAFACQADVGDEAAVVALFEAVDEHYGPLTALVNNAGMMAPASRLETFDAERINRILAVNVTGSLICAREAILRMSTNHGGQGGGILNVSSVAAVKGAPGSYIDYAASKGAIDSFNKGLSEEVAGEGIRVNAVRPGIIDTDIHAAGGSPDRAVQMASSIPMKRAGTAAEVGEVILWLLSDSASYVTGTVVGVTGGR